MTCKNLHENKKKYTPGVPSVVFVVWPAPVHSDRGDPMIFVYDSRQSLYWHCYFAVLQQNFPAILILKYIVEVSV